MFPQTKLEKNYSLLPVDTLGILIQCMELSLLSPLQTRRKLSYWIYQGVVKHCVLHGVLLRPGSIELVFVVFNDNYGDLCDNLTGKTLSSPVFTITKGCKNTHLKSVVPFFLIFQTKWTFTGGDKIVFWGWGAA